MYIFNNNIEILTKFFQVVIILLNLSTYLAKGIFTLLFIVTCKLLVGNGK